MKFFKKYVNIYFDDENLKKEYKLFYDIAPDIMKEGDCVNILYYPKSRIILDIKVL